MGTPWGMIVDKGLGLLGNIGAGIMGTRLGRKQIQLGGQMADEARRISEMYQRPEFQTPQAIQMMMDMYSGRRFQNLPGMNIMTNMLGQQTAESANTIKEMGVGAEGMGALADIYGKQMQAGQNIGLANAQYQDTAQLQYGQALNQLGEWQNMGWQWNEAQPYLEAQRKAEWLDIMGKQAQWEGLKTKMGSWAEMFQGMGSEMGGELSGLLTALGHK